MESIQDVSIEDRVARYFADSAADAENGRLGNETTEKIRLENVNLTYPSTNGATQVLKDVNLTIHEGEIVTLIGPSGSGKSTILNIISDTARTMGARVEGDVRVSWRSRAKGRLGYVLQKDALLPWRTLLGNVELGLEIQGRSKIERQALARDWISRVGLDGFEDAYPHQLSGGMRQRATIVRTLICKPEIVLMDEPFGALDAQTRIILQQLLIDMWAEQRPTICFVTHDLDESILLGLEQFERSSMLIYPTRGKSSR